MHGQLNVKNYQKRPPWKKSSSSVDKKCVGLERKEEPYSIFGKTTSVAGVCCREWNPRVYKCLTVERSKSFDRHVQGRNPASCLEEKWVWILRKTICIKFSNFDLSGFHCKERAPKFFFEKFWTHGAFDWSLDERDSAWSFGLDFQQKSKLCAFFGNILRWDFWSTKRSPVFYCLKVFQNYISVDWELGKLQPANNIVERWPQKNKILKIFLLHGLLILEGVIRKSIREKNLPLLFRFLRS